MSVTVLVTIDEAAERLKALEAADSSNAFEMGDVVLAAVPMVEAERDESTEGRAFAGAAGLFKDQGVTEALKELAEKAGMAWTSLAKYRTVSSRIDRDLRGRNASHRTYSIIAQRPSDERADLLEMVRQPNPDREDGRWTERAIRAHLPKAPGTGSAPEAASDPDEQVLDQVCRGIDHFLLTNDVERLERIRAYWRRTVPPALKELDWWERDQAAQAIKSAERAERKRKAS